MSLLKKSDEAEKIKVIDQVFRNEYTVWTNEYDRYEEGYNFLAGEQYTNSQKSWYKTQRRPTNVFNLVLPIFNAVLGDFVMSPFEENVYPEVGGTKYMAQIWEKVLSSIAIKTEYKDEMIKTLLAGLNRRGFIYPRFSNEIDIDGSVVIWNVDEFQMIFDSRATKYFTEDGMYQIRTQWKTTDEILAIWPHHRSKLKGILKERLSSSFLESTDDEQIIKMVYNKDYADERKGRYRIIEFHEVSWEPTEIAYNVDTGKEETLWLKGKKRDLYMKAHPEIKIIEKTGKLINIHEVVPGLNYYLGDREPEVQDGQFDVINFSPYQYNREAINFFGIMANAIGPQKDFNDSRNQILNIINKSANVGETLKPSQITNWNQIKNRAHEPGVQRLVDENADISKVYKRDEPPKFPFANDRYQNEGQELLSKIVGIAANFWGETQTKSENASLFAQRVREMHKTLAIMDRNMRRVRGRIWNRVIKIVQKNYTSERSFPVMDQNASDVSEVVINQVFGTEIINDITSGDYRVFVSDEEQNPLQRTVRFMKRKEIAVFLMEALGPTAIDYRWLFEDADMGDVGPMLDKIDQVLMQMAEQGQKQEAFAEIQQMLSGAKQKLELDNSGSPQPAEARKGNE